MRSVEGVSNVVVPAKAGIQRLSLRFGAIVAKTLGPRLRGDDAEAPLRYHLRADDAEAPLRRQLRGDDPEAPLRRHTAVPERTPLLSRTGWALVGAALLVNCVLVPIAALALPAGSPFAMTAYGLTLVGKIMCYALVAVALDLVWGYCGILSLGHGLFFALGGYAMGMYLMRQIGRDGVYQSDLPDFMVFLDWKTMPWFWHGSDSFLWAIAMIVLVPGTLAFVFGWFAFRSRVKGVYLSIITQALTYAAMLLFFRNDTGFGGNNGFTDFKRILGFPIAAIETRVVLFVVTGVALVGAFLACRYIVRSKMGRVVTAIRDAESRVMFTGYDPLPYKLAVWTFSAVLCGIAGALFVPQVGIINPSEMAPANSIEMVIWVAVGGRGTLVGGIVGAALVNGAKSVFTAAFAEYWLFFLGAVFVLVTLFLPKGVVGAALAYFRKRHDKPAPEDDRSVWHGHA